MGIEIGAGDEGGVYVPLPPDTRAYTRLGDVTVDGETFAVRRSDDDGVIHYAWVSGPNDDYGFDSFGQAGEPGEGDHVAAIRDFLAGIDPATGYLGDPYPGGGVR
jgi:hypothetical protein